MAFVSNWPRSSDSAMPFNVDAPAILNVLIGLFVLVMLRYAFWARSAKGEPPKATASTKSATDTTPPLSYSAILERSPDAIFLCKNGIVQFANSAARELFGGENAPRIEGTTLEQLAHPDYQMLCQDNFAALMGEVEATPIKVQHPSGRSLDVTVSVTPAQEGDGVVLVRIRNISEFMRANRDVAAQVKRLNSILDTAVDAIVVTNEEGEIETFNRSAETMFGFPARHAIGRPITHLMSTSSAKHHQEKIEQALNQRLEQVGAAQEITAQRSDGNLFPAEISLSLCQLDDRRLFTAIFRDVTERRNFEDYLAHSASHDSLTGLPNRRALEDALQEAIERAAEDHTRIAVWFVDLDGFKMVNDVMGHAAGDELLIEAGRRMQSSLGPSHMVARFGGDEFCIISTNIAKGEAIAAPVERYIEALSKPFPLRSREITLTANVGIALYPDHSQSVTELITHAGAAMVCAKTTGRNLYRFFDPIMRSQSAERLSLENELRRGIKRDELLLHYQPQVDLRSGKIAGLEALVRWEHPLRGMLPPGRFIPIAEQTGLIVPLGDWVLRQACRDLRKLQDKGIRDVTVAVNISAKQFSDSDVVLAIEQAIEESGIDPVQLDVEITESTLMNNPERVIEYLNRLKEIGVHLSIDDFGTGYSSLNYLKRFPVDTLKIDRSFIVEIAENPKDEAIAVTIITLAHSMGMTALAEGVEHASQAKMLINQGCDLIQGFLFSKPIPLDDAVRRLKRVEPLPILGLGNAAIGD